MSQKYYLKVRTWDAAVEMAASMQHRNGAFSEIEGGYLVQWDARESIHAD